MTDVIYEDQWPEYLQNVLNTDERAEYTDELNWWHTLMSDRDQESFAIEGVPGGAPWARWGLKTLGSVERGDPTLQDSGRLRKSLVRGGRDNVDSVGPRESEWGTSVEYATLHNSMGGSTTVTDYLYNSEKKLVKEPGDNVLIEPRPFATLTTQMIDGLAELVADSLVEQMKG